jgi:NitT/TauT family transport system substrate-binding protein
LPVTYDRSQPEKHVAVRGRRGALLFLVCTLLTGCAPASKPVHHPLIRLGSYLWPGSYWVDVALSKGWFEQAGLSVERVDAHLHYFEALDGVVDGKIDAMGFSQFDLVRYVAAGHDLVGVAAVDISVGAEALVARPGIHHLSDLKGKRLSLRRGTYLEYLLSIIAARERFDLSSVILVDQAGPEAIVDFKAGRIDAVLVWEPYAGQAMAAGGEALFTAGDFPGLTYSVMALRHDFIKAHPEDVATLIRVWHRAEVFIREHPDEACDIVARVAGVTKLEVANLLRTVRIVDLADNGRAFSYAAGFESLHGSWRRMYDYLLDHGMAKNRVESPAHLDSEFIRRLD